MSFRQDLKDGEEAEDEFVTLLQSWGWEAGVNTSATLTEKRFYDAWAKKPLTKLTPKVHRPVYTFEIKYDRRVNETGNVFFERETIENSHSHFIVYKLDTDGGFWVTTKDAVMMIFELSEARKWKGSPTSNAGVLITLELFKEIFSPCEEILGQKEVGTPT